MSRLQQSISLSLVLSLLAGSLIPFTAFAANRSSHPSPARTTAIDDTATEQEGLRFRLSDAVEPKQEVILSKTGTGRLYFRIGLNYAPRDLDLNPADYGFSVERKYEALDHATDVRHDGDGSWHIKAGARVRVRVTMVAPSRRYHVALNDPLAAGFEIINPELAVTEAIPVDRPPLPTTDRWETRRNSWWRVNWFDHQNLRDDRAEAFASLLWEGIYNYSYVVRATTPGTFVVPPAKAEEMYQPETFGRSKTDHVVIE